MKYTLSVAAMFRNESHSILEWLEHYVKHGVQHFYLINDDSDDDSVKKLRRFQESGLITLFSANTYPHHIGRQRELYNLHILPILKETEWLLLCDIDEYIWSPAFPTIPALLSCCQPELKQIQVAETLFGSNYQEHQPPSVIQGFTRRDARVSNRDGILKYFVRSDVEYASLNVHHADFVNPVYQSVPHFLLVGPELLRMNHYRSQSRNFWNTIKCSRGDSDFYMVRTPEQFSHDIANEVEDTDLVRVNAKIPTPPSLSLYSESDSE